MIKLQVKDLNFSISGQHILKDNCLEIHEGEFVGLIGPNGCGKSTLLKNIYRVYTPDSGVVFIDGTDVKRLSNRETAKRISVMVQENSMEFDMDVLEMILLGRYAHKTLLGGTSAEDKRIAMNALYAVGMDGYEDRSFLSLSGGEKQRVLVARALTQQARMILLDEPTNHLDVGYQYQIMNILKAQNTTVFSSVHDLNIASYYCDKLILMEHGSIMAYGSPREVLTPEWIRKLFHIDAEITTHPVTGRMQVFFCPPLDA